MSDRYVTVHRTYDPIQADILGDLLRENGLAARVLGTRHGAVIGVGQNILQMHIEVPAEQAGAATDFVESFLEGEGLPPDAPDGLGDDDDDDEPAAARTEERRRSPLLAAGSVLLMFGGSHLYAQRYWTAALLAAGQVIALVSLVSHRWETAATGMVMFGVILIGDLVGGQLAIRSRAGRPSALGQLVTGAALVAAAGGLAAWIGPRVPVPAGAESHYGAEPPVPATTPYDLVD